MNKFTGVSGAIALIDSDTYNQTGPIVEHRTFSHTFDFTNYAYYMTLTVNRADTNGNPGIWYASLN